MKHVCSVNWLNPINSCFWLQQSHRVDHRFSRRSLAPCWRASVRHVTRGMLTMQRVSNFVLHFWSCWSLGRKWRLISSYFPTSSVFTELFSSVDALRNRERNFKSCRLTGFTLQSELFLLLLSHGKLRLTFFGEGSGAVIYFHDLLLRKKFRHGSVKVRGMEKGMFLSSHFEPLWV